MAVKLGYLLSCPSHPTLPGKWTDPVGSLNSSSIWKTYSISSYFPFIPGYTVLIFKTNPFQLPGYLQPFLAWPWFYPYPLLLTDFWPFIRVSAGLLTIYIFITFTRFIASPATLSFIFMPLVLYAYYRANEE
jgi:hypothetical protein